MLICVQLEKESKASCQSYRYGWLTVEMEPQLGDKVLTLARETCELCYSRFATLWNFYPRRPIVVTLLPKQDCVWGSNMRSRVQWKLHYDQILCPPAGYSNTRRLLVVLVHEYTHIVVRSLTHRYCPFWLDEGAAAYFESVWAGSNRYDNFWQESSQGREIPPLYEAVKWIKHSQKIEGLTQETDADAQFMYAVCYKAFKYLIESYGADCVGQLLAEFSRYKGSDGAFRKVLKKSESDFEAEWRAAVSSAATPTAPTSIIIATG